MRIAIFISIFVCAVMPVSAQDFPTLPQDASIAEKSLYGLFDEKCSQCHQTGKLNPGLTGPKGRFDNVLDLKALAASSLIAQGDPEASELMWFLNGDPGFEAMPYGCQSKNTCLTKQEKNIVEDWIIATAPQEKPKREFVSFKQLHESVLLDLSKQPVSRQKRTRYISLRELHNDERIEQEDLKKYRMAVIKTLNLLSNNPQIWTFEPIDPNSLLLRVFLPDLDWNNETWGRLEANYPYSLETQTDSSLIQIKALSQTQTPIIRADWLAATATVSPMYYDILGMPDTLQGLEKSLGIDLIRNVRNQQAIRAGFEESGVSTSNRMIERHPMGTGFFWTSYDFAGNVGRQKFFDYPLGPKGYFETDELAFDHDGGESIFTLPNGFHAYFLNEADGARLDVGPTAIVRDDDYTDGTGEVVNGISCISCHDRGMKQKPDEVRESALANYAFNAEQREQIANLFPGRTPVSKAIRRDERAFFKTLEAAGIDPEVRIGGLEPVRALFVYHEDGKIDLKQAANELGLPIAALEARGVFAGIEMGGMINRLRTSHIARDEWQSIYATLLKRVTDYTSSNETVRQSKISNPLGLKLSTQSTKMRVNDLLEFEVATEKNCDLAVWYVAADKSLLSLPQSLLGAPVLKAGEVRKVPSMHSNQKLRFKTPGKNESLVAHCRVHGIKGYELDENQISQLTRGLSIELQAQEATAVLKFDIR